MFAEGTKKALTNYIVSSVFDGIYGVVDLLLVRSSSDLLKQV